MAMREDVFARLVGPEDSVVAVHYRGYGNSAGRPSERGLQDDSRRILR